MEQSENQGLPAYPSKTVWWTLHHESLCIWGVLNL